MTPHESLTRALLDLADNGRRTPCQLDPGPFTSDDWHERAEAAERCHPCPVLAACDAVGQTEVWNVWAGRDRTPTTRKRTDVACEPTGHRGVRITSPAEGRTPSPAVVHLRPARYTHEEHRS